ncbi:hypothetical protein [Butyrivibrio sp. AE3004]|uniref:hypothetical protein n=1 Tax=Butyrivibrio sp. AE3004 TaxID=1506994 RepID=UPI00049412B1|nr:hypothetical protein [Butyrivibrio sp. AE3004]
MSWQNELSNSITTAKQLGDKLGLSSSETDKLEKIVSRYPMMITPYYFSLIDINDPEDPIAKMCIPSKEELLQNGSYDTSGECENTKCEGGFSINTNRQPLYSPPMSAPCTADTASENVLLASRILNC